MSAQGIFGNLFAVVETLLAGLVAGHYKKERLSRVRNRESQPTGNWIERSLPALRTDAVVSTRRESGLMEVIMAVVIPIPKD